MGDLKEQVIALLKDPSDFDTYDKQAAAIISLARADALEDAAVEAEWAAAFEIARNIRDLKDKPACG